MGAWCEADVGLPSLTNPGDQTKIQVFLHVSSPTNPYRILCSRCETPWWFWFGLASITIAYHSFDLALTRGRTTFTNHYHRTGGHNTLDEYD